MELQPTLTNETGVIKIGATRHCCYGLCKSDSRYADRDYMKDVSWLPFPKPKCNIEKCQRWITACGRPGFTVDRVKKWTYICTKHFIGGKGPTAEHPDPVPANLTEEQVNKMKKKLKPAKETHREAMQSPNLRHLKENVEEDCKQTLSMAITSRKTSTKGMQCYALNCFTYCNANSKSQGITFHKFPDQVKDKGLYEVWVRNCRRDVEPSYHSRICSQHFESKYIIRTLERTYLADNAVPTIFSSLKHLAEAIKAHKKTRTSYAQLHEEPPKSSFLESNIRMDVQEEYQLCSEESTYESHQNNNENLSTKHKVFQCQICSKILSAKTSLDRHLKIHRELKEFKCLICSREFTEIGNFKTHLNIHTGTKNKKFKCHLCSKEFTLQGFFQRHLKKHNVDSKFINKFCLKENKDLKLYMKQHVTSHSDETEVQQNLMQYSMAHSQQNIQMHNAQMIIVQDFSFSKKDMNLIPLESDLDVDPLLIEDEIPPVVKEEILDSEIPPVVKEEISDLILSEEAPSKFNKNYLIINERTVKVENDDNEVFWKNICNAEDVVGDFVKVEEFPDNNYEVT